MGTSPAARLARIKATHPNWTFTKVEPNGEANGQIRAVHYTADRAASGEHLRFASLIELECEFNTRAYTTGGSA